MFDLVEALGRTRSGMTFAELLVALRMPKSSLHALLAAAGGRGYIEQDPASRQYTLGLRAWETGQAYIRQHDFLVEAEKAMRGFVASVNETVQLARLDGNENVYIAKVDSTHLLRLQSEVGGRLLAHATGLGKVLLAELPAADLAVRFAQSGLPRMTPNTIIELAALEAELAVTRSRGFGIDNEEYTPGLFCLALPVRVGGRVAAAISASIPTSRAGIDRLAEALAGLATTSLQISALNGGAAADVTLDRLADPVRAREAIESLVRSGRYRLSFLPQPEPG